MSEVLPYISKRKSKSHVVTGIIEEQVVTIQGTDFDKVIKEFNKQWEE